MDREGRKKPGDLGLERANGKGQIPGKVRILGLNKYTDWKTNYKIKCSALSLITTRATNSPTWEGRRKEKKKGRPKSRDGKENIKRLKKKNIVTKSNGNMSLKKV